MISEIGVDKPLPYSTKCGLPLLQRLEDLKTFDYYPSLLDDELRKKVEKFIILNIKPELKNQDFLKLPKDILIRDISEFGNTGKTALIYKICHELELPTFTVRLDSLMSDTATMTIENIRRIVSFGITCDCAVIFPSTQLLSREVLTCGLLYLLKNTRHNSIFILESDNNTFQRNDLSFVDLVIDIEPSISKDAIKNFLVSYLSGLGVRKKILKSFENLEFKDSLPTNEVMTCCNGLVQEFCVDNSVLSNLERLKDIPCLKKLLK